MIIKKREKAEYLDNNYSKFKKGLYWVAEFVEDESSYYLRYIESDPEIIRNSRGAWWTIKVSKVFIAKTVYGNVKNSYIVTQSKNITRIDLKIYSLDMDKYKFFQTKDELLDYYVSKKTV